MTFLISRPLNIIMEEDESSSRSPSPLAIKARRRHARITRDDLADLDLDTVFSSPTQQSMSSSTSSSPDSLELAFPDLLKFPCPPTSELSSSPGAHSSGLPLTPDSDCEFPLPSPRFNPRRAAIQPFTLNFKREPMDSDGESDSEWYHKEFSKLIASPALSPQLPPSRPDSILFPPDSSPTTKRRSVITDTVYPRRRNSKSRSITIPNNPPPVPPIPPHLRPAPCPPPQRTLVNSSRPPPRSSVPADCVIDLYLDGSDPGYPDSDSSSAFSFTMYEIDFGERQHASTSGVQAHPLPQSPRNKTMSRLSLDSEFAQEVEIDFDDARFELDYRLTLPFAIPATPLDLETDIAKSFEKLREQESRLDQPEPTPASVQTTSQSSPSTSSAYSQDLLYTPTISPFSFSSPSSTSSSRQTAEFNKNERVLKSKWSSSTLGSLQEEARNKNREKGRSPSAKWKLFGGAGGSTPSKSKRPSSSTKFVFPPTPTSPLIFRSPLSPPPSRKTKAYSPSLSPSSPLRWAPSRAYKSKRTSTQSTRRHQPTNSEDIIVIGYGHGAGLKRRGSNATVSSEGGMSEVSTSSSSSSGLARKPIPIEMFLRNAA